MYERYVQGLLLLGVDSRSSVFTHTQQQLFFYPWALIDITHRLFHFISMQWSQCILSLEIHCCHFLQRSEQWWFEVTLPFSSHTYLPTKYESVVAAQTFLSAPFSSTIPLSIVYVGSIPLLRIKTQQFISCPMTFYTIYYPMLFFLFPNPFTFAKIPFHFSCSSLPLPYYNLIMCTPKILSNLLRLFGFYNFRYFFPTYCVVLFLTYKEEEHENDCSITLFSCGIINLFLFNQLATSSFSSIRRFTHSLTLYYHIKPYYIQKKQK